MTLDDLAEELREMRGEIREIRKRVDVVHDVVKGWRGQLVKQGGLVAIALIAAIGQSCQWLPPSGAP